MLLENLCFYSHSQTKRSQMQWFTSKDEFHFEVRCLITKQGNSQLFASNAEVRLQLHSGFFYSWLLIDQQSNFKQNSKTASKNSLISSWNKSNSKQSNSNLKENEANLMLYSPNFNKKAGKFQACIIALKMPIKTVKWHTTALWIGNKNGKMRFRPNTRSV